MILKQSMNLSIFFTHPVTYQSISVIVGSLRHRWSLVLPFFSLAAKIFEKMIYAPVATTGYKIPLDSTKIERYNWLNSYSLCFRLHLKTNYDFLILTDNN